MSAILTVRNLSHQFGKREALSQIEFDIEQGEIFGFLGPNGGGKTTLFRILSTYLYPTGRQSNIELCGIDLLKKPNEIRKILGVVFQSPSLDPKLTIEENLIHQGHLYQLSGNKLKERIEKNLKKFDIDDRKKDRVETLSGGLKRRVEIAKALLHEPKLLLFDEPTTGLDPGARRAFWDDLEKLQKEGVSILVTTHFIEEAERCDRVSILDQGRCVAVGAPDLLKKDIRGDVISVKTKDTAFLKQAIEEKFGVDVKIVDGALHIEKQEGSDFMILLVKSFPGEIIAATISKPSLEDVFIQKTGKRFLESI